MRRFFAAVTAIALACGMAFSAVGCGSKEQSEGEIIKGEDLPYGAMMTRLSENDGVKITTEFDSRFVTEDEAKLISDYAAALQFRDGDLMNQIHYPNCFEYSAKQNGSENAADHIEKTVKYLEDTYAGGKIDFNYVMIEGVEDNAEYEKEYAALEDEVKEAAGEDISDKINSRKMLEIDLCYSLDGEGSHLLSTAMSGNYIYLAIYDIDGKLYIM